MNRQIRSENENLVEGGVLSVFAVCFVLPLRTYYVAEDDLDLLILLCLPPEGYIRRCLC